jgi:hypothetical protein
MLGVKCREMRVVHGCVLLGFRPDDEVDHLSN